MHVDVLEAVASTGIPLTVLSVDPHSLGSGELGTLLPGFLASTSSVLRFSFTNVNIDVDGSEAEGQLFAKDNYSLLKSVLASATALRHLELELRRNRGLRSNSQLTTELLKPHWHPMLSSLNLSTLAVTEVTLLNALVSWGRTLMVVQFNGVFMCGVKGEGWSDALMSLTTMPKLCEIRLFVIQDDGNVPGHSIVDLRHLKHGETTHCSYVNGKMHNNIILRTRDEVKVGLQQLLEGELKYY